METLILLQEIGDGSGPPRSLHVTRSVYIRHIPPKVAAEDIVEVHVTDVYFHLGTLTWLKLLQIEILVESMADVCTCI